MCLVQALLPNLFACPRQARFCFGMSRSCTLRIRGTLSWFLGHPLSGLFRGFMVLGLFRVLLCNILASALLVPVSSYRLSIFSLCLESPLYSCLPMFPYLCLSLVRSVLSEVGLVSVSVTLCLPTCVLISVPQCPEGCLFSPQAVMSPCLLPILSSSCVIVSMPISCFIVIVSWSVCIMVSFASLCVIKHI